MDNNKEKQQYLFQEIIEKNYDPEQFQEYLTNAKPGGDDLDKWTYHELQQIVAKFHKRFDKDKQDPAEEKKYLEEEHEQEVRHRQSILDQYIEAEQTERSMMTKSKLTSGNPLHIDYDHTHESFYREVQCQQAHPTELFKAGDVKVQVYKFEKKEGGIFEQAYVSYFINTPFLGKTVERRYSDFEWLKQRLRWLHPGLPVPPIAKKGQFRRYDDKHLRKRMMILQMFLNKLLEIPELRAEEVVQNFIKLDKIAFQKFKSNFGKIKNILPLKQIKTSTGNVKLELDPKQTSFLSASQKFIADVQPTIKSFYKDFKGVATSLEYSSEVLHGLARKCERLDEYEKNFRKNHHLTYCANNFFTITSQAITRLADQLNNQARIFRTQTYSMLKYESFYMLNIIDNFQALSEVQQKYIDAKTSLARKKLKLFDEGNPEKWQLQSKNIDKKNKVAALDAMLPKQTRKLAKLREVYALYSSEMNSELQRYFRDKNSQLGGYTMQWCRNQTRLCSQMMMLWVDAETNLMGMRENKMVRKC